METCEKPIVRKNILTTIQWRWNIFHSLNLEFRNITRKGVNVCVGCEARGGERVREEHVIVNIFKCHWMWYVKSIFNIINFLLVSHFISTWIHRFLWTRVRMREREKWMKRSEKHSSKWESASNYGSRDTKRDWDKFVFIMDANCNWYAV
jgi:hypothetical protein